MKGKPCPPKSACFAAYRTITGCCCTIPESGATASIDAPEAAPVEAALKETGWKLTDILVTHHHHDHTGGIAALKKKYHCRVVAPAGEAAKIPAVDETVHEGDKVSVGKLSAKVIETPGHTLDHIAYWFPKDQIAFVGDTLFSIGCGRVIEGNAEMMWKSLLKSCATCPTTPRSIAATNTPPPISNSPSPIDEDNPVLEARAAQVGQLLAEGAPTIPVTIGDEKLANPFLRADVARPRLRHRHGRQAGRKRCSPKSARARISSKFRPLTLSA